jgi:hypothetical protein
MTVDEEALFGTDIEALAAGNCCLEKGDQDASWRQNYESKFALD